MIRTADGHVPSLVVTSALGELPQVDLAVTFGVPAGEAEVVVAALELIGGEELRGSDLDAALSGLPPERRPLVVRLVGQIPISSWYRPLIRALREEGIRGEGPGRPAFFRDEAEGRYRPLDATIRSRLAAGAVR